MITWVEQIQHLLPACEYCYQKTLEWVAIADPMSTPASKLFGVGLTKDDIKAIRRAAPAEIHLNSSGHIECCRAYNTMGRVPV